MSVSWVPGNSPVLIALLQGFKEIIHSERLESLVQVYAQ